MLKREDDIYDKGFLGAARSSKDMPYVKIKKTPDMYQFGEKSNFITPNSSKSQNNAK